MTTTSVDTPVLPERLAGQGLDEQQYESGDRAIHILLTDPVAGPQTDLVITYRDGAYEVWAQRGMIRFQRFLASDGRGLRVSGHRADRREPDRQPGPQGDRHDRRRARGVEGVRLSGHRRQHGVHRARARELSVRLRAHRAAVRQPERAGPCRQPEMLCVRPATRSARGARRRPGALAADLLRPRHRPRRHDRRAIDAGGHRAHDREAVRPAADRRARRHRPHVERAGRCAGRLSQAPGRPRARRDHRQERRAAPRARVHLPARRSEQHRTEVPPRRGSGRHPKPATAHQERHDV